MTSKYGRNQRRAHLQELALLKDELANERLKEFGHHGKTTEPLLDIEELPGLQIREVSTNETVSWREAHKVIGVEGCLTNGVPKQLEKVLKDCQPVLFRGHKAMMTFGISQDRDVFASTMSLYTEVMCVIELRVVRGDQFYKEPKPARPIDSKRNISRG